MKRIDYAPGPYVSFCVDCDAEFEGHMLAVRCEQCAAQRIEAQSDETPKAVQPEGREPDGEADAPERCSEHSIHSSSGRG